MTHFVCRTGTSSANKRNKFQQKVVRRKRGAVTTSGQLLAGSWWLAQTPVTDSYSPREQLREQIVIFFSCRDADAIWHTSNRILHPKHLWHNQFAFETCDFPLDLIISVGEEVRDVDTSGMKTWRIECINVPTYRFVASRGVFAEHFTEYLLTSSVRYFCVRLTQFSQCILRLRTPSNFLKIWCKTIFNVFRYWIRLFYDFFFTFDNFDHPSAITYTVQHRLYDVCACCMCEDKNFKTNKKFVKRWKIPCHVTSAGLNSENKNC